MPPHGSQRDRLKTHDQELEELRARTFRASGREALLAQPRMIRLARTKALNGVSYPTSGDEVPIQFVSPDAGDFDTLLTRSEHGSEICKILSGRYVPKDEVISVFEYAGLWWSDTALGLDRIKGFATAAVAGTASFTIDGIGVTAGSDPRATPGSPTETVTVQNDLGEHCNDDAPTWAEYDNSDGLWHVYKLDSICPP